MAGPHDGQPVLEAGEPLERARAAMILLHGRGAGPADILYDSAPLLEEPWFTFRAPAAAQNTWYPNPFTAPLESNEPWLSSALEMVDRLLAQLDKAIPASRIVLLGFSQGACLALEYAARRPRRYGALVGWSGALIGPLGTGRDERGSLAGTPVFLGCSDPDPYVSADLVSAAGAVLERIGGRVDLRFYPGMGHTVNADEITTTRRLMAALTRSDELGEAGAPQSRRGGTQA